MASPEQNINRHPMDHYNAQTPTQTKPEENSNTNRLKTNDPPQEKTKKEAKQKENETDNAKGYPGGNRSNNNKRHSS